MLYFPWCQGKFLRKILVGVDLAKSVLIQTFLEERVCVCRTLLKIGSSSSPFTLFFLFGLIGSIRTLVVWFDIMTGRMGSPE